MKRLLPRALGVLLVMLAGLRAGGEGANAPAESDAPHALVAREVAVVANVAYPGSVELAKHYMQGRGIPENQLLVTGMTREEMVGRAEYERTIARPIQDFLTHEKLDHVRCVVLMIGVPLKIDSPPQDASMRQMEILLRTTLQHEVGTLVDRAEGAQRIALPADAPSPPALNIEPAAKAIEQLNALLHAITNELRDAVPRIGALPPGPAREKATQEWLQILSGTLGWVSPVGLGLRGVPDTLPSPAERKAATDEASALLRDDPTPASLNRLLAIISKAQGSAGVVRICDKLLPFVKPDLTWRASVDSELCTLFWPPFTPAGAMPNPLAIDRHARSEDQRRTLMACRLDGPDVDVVRSMIDTSLAVEARGLSGKVYIDARGRNGGDVYSTYDKDLRALAKLVENQTTMPLVLNDDESLFQPGACPDAALYCGWYSLSKYVPAFTFKPGAVGFHIASAEAVWLRKPGLTLWCPSLLRDGVVATLGPVEEPYLTAFPLPSEFFGRLLTGTWTLADCYFQTTPRLSWMMTLIGDPLYNPCKLNGPIDPRDLEAALAGETE